jgi:pilus assembly protein CpaB
MQRTGRASGCGKGERVRNWRIISTIAAVVFAVVAGVLVWKYLTDADDRAEAKKDLVPVLVAKNKIARGTVFDAVVADKLFVQKDIPQDSLAPGQIEPASDDQLLNLYKGKVAATDIYAGTPLVSEQFVQSSQLVSTVAGAIPKGKEAITVNLDQTHSVGGFVTPGDQVNVLVHLPVKTPEGQSSQMTAFLIPGVKVIAVGASTVLPTNGNAQAQQTADDGTTPTTQPQAQPASLITLQVTPRQAQQIVHAVETGSIWLSLNPPDFKSGDFQNPTEIVEQFNLFNQSLGEAQRRAGLQQDLPSPADVAP